MNAKTTIRIILILFISGSLVYLAVDTFSFGNDGEKLKTPPVETGYVMYYFSQGKDCTTCDNIEAYAYEVLNTHFAAQLKDTTLVWQKVDTDQPEHEHFNTDFNLYTKSIVLVQYENGEHVKWENLEKVWDLVYEKPAYSDYIKSRTTDFLSEAE